LIALEGATESSGAGRCSKYLEATSSASYFFLDVNPLDFLPVEFLGEVVIAVLLIEARLACFFGRGLASSSSSSLSTTGRFLEVEFRGDFS
jgi:hypothetical protein